MVQQLQLPIVVSAALILGACGEKDLGEELPTVTAGAYPATPTPSDTFFDDVVLVSAQPTYEVDDRELGNRAAGVQLARMAVSEATSLQPLTPTWRLDMQGILQVARNTQERGESLLEALRELSPHVGNLKAHTDPRQRWTSTLPATGSGAPELWDECTGWEVIRGRKRLVPLGCNGFWKLGAGSWDQVRSYAISLVQQRRPPASVQGNPTTWGGLMDIAEFLQDRPGMCWLESGQTVNYFFGLKTDPANTCKPIPAELVKESRVLSAAIASRRTRER